jgi:hypothetical protein
MGMKGDFIIWNTKTGVYDGAYVEPDMALDRYFQMSKDNDRGYWLLVQVVYPDENVRLADEKFHTTQEDLKQ